MILSSMLISGGRRLVQYDWREGGKEAKKTEMMEKREKKLSSAISCANVQRWSNRNLLHRCKATKREKNSPREFNPSNIRCADVRSPLHFHALTAERGVSEGDEIESFLCEKRSLGWIDECCLRSVRRRQLCRRESAAAARGESYRVSSCWTASRTFAT